MTKLLKTLAAALVALTATTATPVHAGFETGQSLMTQCGTQVEISKGAPGKAIMAISCMQYISGVFDVWASLNDMGDLDAKMCMDRNKLIKQQAANAVLMNIATRYNDKLNITGELLIYASMLDVWGCEQQ